MNKGGPDPAINVMYVDDEPFMHEVVTVFLEEKGVCRVTAVNSPAEALGALASQPFDVVVSDYDMPGMNGIGFLQFLRDSGNPIPFIIFTGKGREEVVVDALNAGADFYLQKGGMARVQFIELLNMIRMAVGKRRSFLEIAESERRYRALFETTTDIIQVFAENGRLQYVNPAWENTLGYSRRDLPSMEFLDIVHPDDRDGFRRTITELLTTPGTHEAEARFISRDGREILVEGSCSSQVEKGVIRGVQGIFRDVTAKRRSERVMRQYELLKTSTRDALFFVSEPGMTVLEANDAASLLYGYERGEMTGLPLESLFAKEIQEVPGAQRPRADGLSEAVSRRKDGSLFYAEFSSSPATLDGAPVTLIVLRDISDRKAVENLLVESEQRYRDLYDSAPVGFFSVNAAKGVIIRSNAYAARLVGYTHDQIIGMPVLDLYADHPEGKTKAKSTFFRFSQGETVEQEELLMKRADGSHVWISLSVNPVYNHEGAVFESRSVVQDISARKMAYEIEVMSRERLETLVQLSTMGQKNLHDLATFIMESAIRLTRSSLAFVGDITPDEESMEIMAWSKEAMDQCMISGAPLVFPIGKAGIWADAVRERRICIVNDYAGEKVKKLGLPPGHVPITRFMAVPVFDQGAIVLLAAVANKETDYDETDAHQMTLLLSGIYSHIRRWKMDESIHALHKSLDTVEDEIIWLDPDAGIIDLNEAACRMLGQPRTALVGKRITDIHEGFFRDTWKGVWEKFAKDQTYTFTTSFLLDDGRTCIRDVRCSTISQGDGTIMCAIARDITERLAQEKKLEEHAAFMQTLLDVIPNPIFYLDESGRYLGCNIAFEAFFNIRREDLTGKTVFDLLPAYLASIIETRDRYLLDHAGSQIYGLQVVRADGSQRDVIFYKATFPGEDGHTGGMIGSMVDVTETSQELRDLTKTEEKYRFSINGSYVMVFEQDRDLRYSWVSNPLFELFPSDILGKRDADLFGTELAGLMEAVNRNVMDGKGPDDQVLHGIIQGKPGWMYRHVEPRYSEGGEIMGIRGVLYHDIRMLHDPDLTGPLMREASRQELCRGLPSCLLSPAGTVLWANRECAAYLKIRQEDLVSTHYSLHFEKSHCDEVRRFIDEVRPGTSQTTFLPPRGPGEGLQEPVTWSIEGCFDAQGVLAGVFLTGTVRKSHDQTPAGIHSEEIIGQLEQNAKIFATLSDEIRNPVSVIIGLADLERTVTSQKIIEQALAIDKIIRLFDSRCIESQKVRNYLQKHQDFY